MRPNPTLIGDSNVWLRDRLGCEIDAELLQCALTHRSYAYENGGLPTN